MAPDDGHPPAEVIIGIDIGTTAAKVSAFGVGSSWWHTVAREYPLLRPRPGWEVQQPDVLVAAMLAALSDAVAACGGAQVLGLAVSSAMHGLVGLDAARQPLTPLITWADSRATEVVADLRAAGAATELHRRSGTPVHPMSPLTKIMWFRRHEPELFGRVRTWTASRGGSSGRSPERSPPTSPVRPAPACSICRPASGVRCPWTWPGWTRHSCRPCWRPPTRWG